MRQVRAKNSSTYVWGFIQLNRSRMMIFATLFIMATMLLAINIKPYASFGLVMIPLSYVLGWYAYKSYVVWSSGPKGEEMVLESLKELGDDYVLLKNVVIPPNSGDTDYIVVGPTGIFVIETKNVGGVVVCNGDKWSRYKVGRYGSKYALEIGNPSRQAKRSAKALKDFILKNKRGIFGSRAPHIWVYSILTFTNRNVSLNLTNPTIDVLPVGEINGFILRQKDIRLAKKVVDNIADAIAKHSAR